MQKMQAETVKNLPNNCVLRQVGEESADILTEIHKKCFPRYWNRDAFTDFFAVKNTFAFLLEKENIPLAMSVYRISFEQVDVLTIAVLPECRRQGSAKFLVEDMIENSRKLGAEKIVLEVENGNDAAIKLYENCGFKHIGRRKLYYLQLDGSLTDALVMSRKL